MVKWVTRKVLYSILGKLFETHHLMVDDIMRTLCLLCRNYMSNCCAIIVLKILILKHVDLSTAELNFLLELLTFIFLMISCVYFSEILVVKSIILIRYSINYTIISFSKLIKLDMCSQHL